MTIFKTTSKWAKLKIVLGQCPTVGAFLTVLYKN